MRIEDRRIEMASNQYLTPRRAQEYRCRFCGRPVTIAGLPAHARSHGQQPRSARQRALRAQARELFKPSQPERIAKLRAQARALRGEDDWNVYFRGQRALTQLSDRISGWGLELFGDPDAFRR